MSLCNDYSAIHSSDSYLAAREKSPDAKATKQSNASPSKKHRSMPTMRSPEKVKNPMADTPKNSALNPDTVDIESFKSPLGMPSLRIRSTKSPVDSGDSLGSVRSPRSPRSPRNEHEVMSSRRHRIDSPMAKRISLQKTPSSTSSPTASVSRTVTQTVTSTTARGQGDMLTLPSGEDSQDKVARQRLSSPPNTLCLGQPSPEQMNALADLWMQQVLYSTSGKQKEKGPALTEKTIATLGRTDGKINMSDLPKVLCDLKVSFDKQGKVSLSNLLNLMLANHLGQSDAGKTIKTMQVTVMDAQPTFAAIRLDDLIAMDNADAETELKKKMADAVRLQANVCIDVAFGPNLTLSECRLPPALLDFWKLLDERLVREAANNPLLDREQVLKARSNLGIDLLLTRQMYPFALKPVQVAQTAPVADAKPDRVTSDTSIPVLVTVFANAMSDAFHRAWPVFFTDAIRHFD